MVMLIGVIVGYVLAYLPKIVSVLVNRHKAIEQKAREPTEEEKRKMQKAVQAYQNFLSYNGDAQEDL